jgi:hypothetical protein
MRKRIAVALTFVVVCVIGITLWVRSIPSTAVGTVATNRETAGTVDTTPQASLVTPVAKAEDRQAVPPAARQQERTDAKVAVEPLDAFLVVRVVTQSTGEPLEGVRVVIYRGGPSADVMTRHVDGTKGTIEESPITARDGRVEFELPSGIDLHLLSNSTILEAPSTDLEVPALQRGEHRDLVVRLDATPELRCLGIVIAHETGLPVPAATIVVMREADWTPTESARGRDRNQNAQTHSEVTTGGDGRFDLTMRPSKGSLIRVWAEGFTAALVDPALDRTELEKSFTILLDRSAAIEALVVDAEGRPQSGIAVTASTKGYHILRDGEDTLHFDGGHSPKEVRGSGTTGMDGRCTLTGLPARTDLYCVLTRKRDVVQNVGQPVSLEPGQIRRITWSIGGGCKLSGVLVDQTGSPVPKHAVWLCAARWKRAEYFETYDQPPHDFRTTADEHGRFEFKDVNAGLWKIGPAPETDFRGTPRIDALAPCGTVVEVPEGTAHLEIIVKAQRGLFVRGHVMDAAGVGSPDTFVRGEQAAMGMIPDAITRDDGTFVLGPLMPGRLLLTAESHETDVQSEPVTANGGDENVVLKLRAGGAISGKLVDAMSGRGCRGTLDVFSRVSADADRPGMLETENDGSFAVSALLPGTYDLTAHAGDGRFAVLRGVEVNAGSVSSGLVLTLEAGAKVRLRYQGPDDSAGVAVIQGGTVIARFGVAKGRVSIEVVPSGKLTLQLTGDDVHKPKEREIDLVAGEVKEIVFTDDG